MVYSERALRIVESVTLEISAKAKEMKARGEDVISFSVGEPDFNTPNNIIEAAIRAMNEGKTKYTNTSGIIELKEAICEKFKNDNNLIYKPNQIVVSNGGKQSLTNAIMALVNEGDEVIIPNPYWVTYPELVKLSGGKPIFCTCSIEDGYKLNIDKLRSIITEKTKAIIINSPSNPTGVIYNRDELIEIAAIAKENNIFIISDEIYEKLIYEDIHESIANVSEDAYKRTIIINGLSKAYSMTGWRVGYTASSEDIARLMNNIQSHTTSNSNSISQYAGVEALKGDQSFINSMKYTFKERRDYMIGRLNKIESISYIYPKGAFYIMVNIKKILNENNIKDTIDFSRNLLEIEKLAVIPGEAFGMEGFIRFSYATSLENIEKGMDRFEKYLKSMKL